MNESEYKRMKINKMYRMNMNEQKYVNEWI